MSTPNTPSTRPTLQELRTHALEIDPDLRAQAKFPVVVPAQLLALEKLNATLIAANEQFLTQSRSLYQALALADLSQETGKALLAKLKTDLNTHLQSLDETSTVDGQGRKSYLIQAAGFAALELQATLDVRDYLLSSAEQLMLEDCSRGPSFRPGMYSLNFSYQDKTVTFAGAFVLTRKPSPVVDNLTSGQDLGHILLFTPNRGLEGFDSLTELDEGLKAILALAAGRKELCQHLPARYQGLDAADIWPLHLLPIEGQPLFEHTYNAILDKRRQDIDLALSLVDNPRHDAALLKSALDDAVKAALPDLSLRLAFRQQQLLERSVYNTLPDWYRSADQVGQETLGRCIQAYNQARATFVDLLGPAASPLALADYQLTEHLDEALEIHDLDLQQLQITTRRQVANVGTYEQQRSLAQLSYSGLHTGDELPGSDFLTNTTLTYAGATLQGDHAGLNAQSLLDILREPGLQPRIDFAAVQKQMQDEPELKQAARDLFDQRLVLLAYVARLRGDLSLADHQLFEALRAATSPRLCAQTVMLHGAQLMDLWLLREEDDDGRTRRLLMCTPESPRERQFMAFADERECQTHIIAWAADKTRLKGRTMSDYLLEQTPLRFRPKMGTFLTGLGFRPDGGEHEEVTFGPLCTHAVCLDAMVVHAQSAAVDAYEYSTAPWYRSASAADRARLTSLAEDAEGALRVYNARPDSPANFITFEAFLHEKAKFSLNTLLGRSQNDIDPNTVYVSAPWPLVGGMPRPMSYTLLYRDGYADNVGFIDPKFSTSATFSGPADVDLSRLTPQNVARAVTGVWIGQRYIDEVRTRLQGASSPGYSERRNATLAINQLQMKYAALDCCLRGHIARVDLAWLEHAIDSLGDTTVARRNLYKVHRLTIDGEWVMGVYLFSHADNPALMYTPNAPDGIAVREARLFNYWLKKVDGVSAYLNDRVALKSKVRVASFLETARNGLPESINRTTPSPARHDPIAHATPLSDLRHELYNMVLQRKIDDVFATTVNRTQKIIGILWTCVELVTAVATIPFPILSLSLGGLLAFKDIMLAISAFELGDKDGALQHFLGYLANIGGALLFDFRAAIKGPFNSFSLRPAIKARKHAVLSKAPDSLTPADMSPVLFGPKTFWVKNAPDALGRHLLYLYDPINGRMLSTARLVNKNAKGEWVRSGVTGGVRKKYQVLQEDVDQPLANYEILPRHGKDFRAVLDSDFVKGVLHPDDPVMEGAQGGVYEQLKGLRDRYAKQVEQLTEDAQKLYAAPPARPSRTGLPVLAPESSPSTVLATLFPLKQALIIGAPNASAVGKQLLIEDIQALAAKGLKRLYIENLPADGFRNKLKIINGEARGDIAYALKKVEDHLARVDAALGWGTDAPFTFRKLMLEAHRHKVAIDGVDGSASYHMEHVLELSEQVRFIPRNSKLRNFYSHKALAQKNSDDGWIALVDHSRIGSTDEVPGLADLQNAIALRVDEVAPNQAVGVRPDSSSAALSRGDYTLTMACAAQQTLPIAGPSRAVPLPTAPSHYSVFDLPARYKNNLEEMVYSRRALDSRYGAQPTSPNISAFEAFQSTRDRLERIAGEALAVYTPQARPAFTDLAAAATVELFIERLYKQKLGLIISESHVHQSSKQFLIKYMRWLKKQGVKTLYMEHLLTDLHQVELESFFNTAKMPENLKRYLKAQDKGHMPDYSGDNTYTQVIKAANKEGIRVRALDCTASYHTKGTRASNARQTFFSYFANEVIKADQAARGPHKWVALMGSAHADMFHGVPGIAQLQDAVSLTVRDVAPGSARSLHPGRWEIVEKGLDTPGIMAVRSDFKLDVGMEGMRAAQARSLPDRARLKKAGEFLIERPSATEANLVHYSRSGEIVSTPIQIDDKGYFFIERWPQLKDQRFVTLDQLIAALKIEVHLTAV